LDDLDIGGQVPSVKPGRADTASIHVDVELAERVALEA
jgi:hypothetical protein